MHIQGRFHFLLKSHAALQHHKYIDYPCHWRLCQGRCGLREAQWAAVPLTPDLLRGHQAHLSLWFSPRTARSRKIEKISSTSTTWRYKHRKEGQYNKCGRDTVWTKSQCYIWVPNFGLISICWIRGLSLPASAKQSKWWVYIILAKCWSMAEQNSIRTWQGYIDGYIGKRHAQQGSTHVISEIKSWKQKEMSGKIWKVKQETTPGG